jgi:D-alanine-D-alanine ligase
MYDVPYVFSDPLVCAVTLDKAVAKRLVRSAGLHTPDFHVVRSPADLDAVTLAYPVFAKPLAEGTGVGIDARSRIDGPDQLRPRCLKLLAKFRQPVLVEEFLPGREFTTGILGAGANARVLGTMEVRVVHAEGRGIYSLETKEKCEEQVQYSPLRERPLKDQVESLALESYRALECRDTGRVDIRLDGRGRPAFLEINPLPGLHPAHSDLPMIATQEGMSYPDLIGSIIRGALERLENTDENQASKHAGPV